MMEPAASTSRSGRLQDFDHVPGAAAGGDDVLHDHGGLAGLTEKPRRSDILRVSGSRSVNRNGVRRVRGPLHGR